MRRFAGSARTPLSAHFAPLFATFRHYTRGKRAGSIIFRFANNDLLTFIHIIHSLQKHRLRVSLQCNGRDMAVGHRKIERSFYKRPRICHCGGKSVCRTRNPGVSSGIVPKMSSSWNTARTLQMAYKRLHRCVNGRFPMASEQSRSSRGTFMPMHQQALSHSRSCSARHRGNLLRPGAQDYRYRHGYGRRAGWQRPRSQPPP